MEENNNIEIHETAFVTSTFRASNENLSKDHFASLWKNTKTEKWIWDYLKKVSSEEAATHCLRNRYFLDKIKECIDKNDVEVVINFGAGFSMYPFLLPENIINIEIDKPEIITYKTSKLDHWQKIQTLPRRDLYLIGVDFSKNYKEELLSEIQKIKGNKKSFILIEGVLFFLDKRETLALFDFFNSIQYTGDFIGSASFRDELKKTRAFKKLMQFFGEKVSKTKESDYQTIEDEYYQKINGYSVIDHQDYFSLSKQYDNTILLEKELILNEHFYLLQKDAIKKSDEPV